jgi:tripartite-type tricarboxylate transporter receptor subunit TctC
LWLRRRVVLSLLASGIAQAFPEQPIKIIVTFPPGGSSDIVIRALQPLLSEDLHQTVVIENRAGAGGNIGIAAVAQAAPDGYTLGVAAAGVLTVNPHLNRAAMSFDPLKDLIPVTLLKFRSCWSPRNNPGSRRSATRLRLPGGVLVNCRSDMAAMARRCI